LPGVISAKSNTAETSNALSFPEISVGHVLKVRDIET
jgi:hypothetical protein